MHEPIINLIIIKKWYKIVFDNLSKIVDTSQCCHSGEIVSPRRYFENYGDKEICFGDISFLEIYRAYISPVSKFLKSSTVGNSNFTQMDFLGCELYLTELIVQ